jgi:hypothetical protein
VAEAEEEEEEESKSKCRKPVIMDLEVSIALKPTHLIRNGSSVVISPFPLPLIFLSLD